MKRALVALFAFTCVALAQAQMASSSAATPQAAAPVKDPVTAGLRVLLTRSRNNTLGSISAMPADKFSYKPTPDQMSFAHLVVHIIGFNNGFCAKAADVAEPKIEEVKESDSKEKLLAAATASYDFCADVLGKMDDSKLGDTIELFGGRQGPRALADLILSGGWADHYAAAAMYLRLNGIVPPSAQPKK
jgi:hypothetical protein